MKLYLKIYGIFFYTLLSISALIFIFTSTTDLISAPKPEIRNMDLGVETSDTVSDISSFWDISSPFFFDKEDIELDHLANSEVCYLLTAEDDFYEKAEDPYNRYLQIRDYSLYLIKYYQDLLSSKDNVFVTMGASSTPIQAFVEGVKQLSSDKNIEIDPSIESMMSETEFVNIVFSKALMKYNSILPVNRRYSSDITTKEIHKAFFKLFDKYVKDPSIFNGKNIIIMDFTMTARSLFSFSRLFLRYLDFKSIPYNSIHLHLIRMFPNNLFIDRFSELDNIHVSNISKAYPILAFNLLRSNFDKYRKYPKYEIKGRNSAKVSKEYQNFVSSIVELMKKDEIILGSKCPSLFKE